MPFNWIKSIGYVVSYFYMYDSVCRQRFAKGNKSIMFFHHLKYLRAAHNQAICQDDWIMEMQSYIKDQVNMTLTRSSYPYC